MTSYVILGIAFLYTVTRILRIYLRGRRPVAREEIDERLLAALNGGDRTRV